METKKLYKVGSRFNGKFAHQSKSGRRYEWSKPGVLLDMSFDEIVELVNSPGGEAAVSEILILPKEVTEELGFNFEPEYYYSFEQLKTMVSKASVDVIAEAIRFNNKGIGEAIKFAALEAEISDANVIKLIEDKFDLDYNSYLDWKTETEELPDTRERTLYFNFDEE